MKLAGFFLMAVVMHVCSPAMSQRVTIAGKNLSLEQVFTAIRKQTGLEFFYQSALLRTTRPVSLDVYQMPVDEVLKICLQEQGLGFSVRGGTIIIFKEKESTPKLQSQNDPVIPYPSSCNLTSPWPMKYCTTAGPAGSPPAFAILRCPLNY